jgi:O-antigen ligase
MALSCLEMVRARPFSGFGLGTFEAVYPAFASFDTGQRVNHAHNDYAEFAAEGGLPLLALFLTVVFWSLRTAWRVPWTIGVVAVFAHALVDYPLQTAAVWAWTLTLLSAGVAESGTTPAPGSERRPAR